MSAAPGQSSRACRWEPVLVAHLVKATPQVLAGKSEGVLKVPSILGRVSGMVCCAEHLLKILSCPQAPQARRTAP